MTTESLSCLSPMLSETRLGSFKLGLRLPTEGCSRTLWHNEQRLPVFKGEFAQTLSVGAWAVVLRFDS